MPRVNDFVLASCQATVFTPDEEVSAAKIVAGLTTRWSSRFDGEPVVLPLPAAVPREIPRVILQDKRGTWRCEVSSARVNIFWRRTQDVDPAPALGEFFEDAAARLIEYQDFQRARAGRLAAVLNRFTQADSPGLYLAQHFCHERWLRAPLNRPESFELHAHKQYGLADFRVNSWVRNKTAALAYPESKTPRPIVLVEQDLNTLPEDAPNVSLNPADIRRFFGAVVPEFDHILGLYYPNEA
jgi:hypothetical protein